MGESAHLTTRFLLDSSAASAATLEGWKLPSDRSRNPAFITLRNTLLSHRPPAENRGEDLFFWESGDHQLRQFSSKKTWNCIRPTEPKKEWAKKVWFSGAIPKHAFTFWVANLDRLPVKARLISWGLPITPTYCLCNLETETRDHVFLHCEFSSEVWSQLLLKLGLPSFIFMNWDILMNWLSTRPPGTVKILNRIATQSVIYHLWRERNNRVHNNSSMSATALFCQIDRNIRDILLARRTRKSCRNLLSIWFTHM